MTPEEVVIYAMMRGKRQFVRDVTEMGYSIRALGLESETVGRSFERVAHRGFLMNQALFTIRRFSYMGTLALTGAGAAAIKWGFDYNNAIQTAQVALQKFFPSQQALNDSLQRLWTIAKFTPFQIRDMTTAFRALYPAFRSLGISANSTIDTIQGIIDGLSVAGKVSGPALQRATIALQHMAFQGRLTGISVNSLARDGIPIFAILRSELGLTGDQMHRIGQLGIPANVAMQAIIHYMRTTPGYAGAAYRQSTMTVSGLFSTFKDNMSRLMGELEKNFFGRIQGRLVTMNQWFNRFGNSINTSGRSVTDIIRAIDPAAVVLWRQIAGDLNLFWINFRNLTREVFHSKALWGTLYLGLLLLHGVLYALVPLTNHFGWALNILVPLFVTYVVWTKAAAFWSGVLAAEEAILTKTTGELTFAQFLLKGAAIATAVAMRGLAIATAIWEVASAGYARGAGGQFRAMTTLERLVYRTRLAFLAGIRSIVAFGVAVKGLWTVAVAGYARGANGQFRALTTLEKLVLRLRLAMFAAARATLAFGKAVLLLGRTILVFLATNPIGWAILLISVLVILYFKWKWFHNLVNESFTWIIHHAPLIAAALTLAFGPIGAAIGGLLLIIRYWDRIKRFFGGGPQQRTVQTPMGTAVQTRSESIPHTGGGRFRIGIAPHMAAGGTVAASGFSWVGENGPELMALPRGATIAPANSRAFNLPEAWMRGREEHRPIRVQVKLDKKVLLDAIATEQSSAEARA